MLNYAYGLPGSRAIWIKVQTEAEGLLQAQAFSGGVSLPHDGDQFPATISADGASLEEIVASLDDLKTAKWKDALAYRNIRQSGGWVTPLGRVDTTDNSQRLINGAVSMALVAQSKGEAFSIDWTMADNSVVTHDADAMIALGLAVGQFINACQMAGTIIRNAIDAAADQAALDGIDLQAGYPA